MQVKFNPISGVVGKWGYKVNNTTFKIKLKTIDGDVNDARFFDSKNKFVVLRGKGNEIKKDTTSFMIRN